jgi:hypothetical protein
MAVFEKANPSPATVVHEVTHVMQERERFEGLPGVPEQVPIVRSGDARELAAERMEGASLRGASIPVDVAAAGRAAPALALKPKSGGLAAAKLKIPLLPALGSPTKVADLDPGTVVRVVRVIGADLAYEVAVVATNQQGFVPAYAIDEQPAPPGEEAPKGPTVESYVDNFSEVIYDIDYRLNEGGSPSNWMTVVYGDGTAVDLNIMHDFSEGGSGRDTRNELANGKIGAGGRFFPQHLNAFTTPRLWAERQKAINEGVAATQFLMEMEMVAVGTVLSTPAFPAGNPTLGDVKGSSVGRPRTARSQARSMRPRMPDAKFGKPKPPAYSKPFEQTGEGATVRNPTLQRASGGPIHLEPGKEYIWSMGEDLDLVVGEEVTVGPGQKLGHPTITEGAPSRISGELRSNPDGSWTMNNLSGRYSAYASRARQMLANAAERMKRAGVNVRDINYVPMSPRVEP